MAKVARQAVPLGHKDGEFSPIFIYGEVGERFESSERTL